MPRQKLTLFDLDHTLLTGDSDVLWCDFLIAQGLLDRDQFAARNADMDARYRAGTVDAREFSEFYIGTLAGRRVADCEALRAAFLSTEIAPRIPPSAHALVRQHLDAGDRVVMTTATNRYLTELTAQHVNIAHLIATEPEIVNGVFTGKASGSLNMREGKVLRLSAWLAERGMQREALQVTAYSDSINDLPLLQFADTPVAVNPDATLHAWANNHQHRVISLR
jgi:HAD superfamily hydrolase (TIGR01490 family)